MTRTTKAIVDEEINSGNASQKDMLASFSAHRLSHEEAHGETMFIVLAGFDAIAMAIRTTLLHLMTISLVYEALQTRYR
jgi:cytochrome P450